MCYIFFFLQNFIGAGAAAAGLLAITPGSSHMVRQVFGQVSDHIIPLLVPFLILCNLWLFLK
jgi:hypothetical protein